MKWGNDMENGMGNELQKGKFNVIIGAQAGSESKGKLSAYLCDRDKPDLLVMTSSPNAGHTCITPEGKKMVSYHLPIGSVMCDCPIILTPASIINPKILEKEIRDLGIDPKRIFIDTRASVITACNLKQERDDGLSDLGSTLQGVGSTRCSKMMRKGGHTFTGGILSYLNVLPVDSVPLIHNYLRGKKKVLCESTQGFDLDLEHGIDRHYCTSKMVNTSMILAESGIPPQCVGNVYGVFRPYPIRVNNRTGTSGPYTGAKEISWEEVAKRCGFPGDSFGEMTTTTGLLRRVFTFSWHRFYRFIRVCAPTHLALQFANYLDWNLYGEMDSNVLWENSKLRNIIISIESHFNIPISFVGTGPGHKEMVEMDMLTHKGVTTMTNRREIDDNN